MTGAAPQIQHALVFPLTEEGITGAEAELARLRKAVTSTPTLAAAITSAAPTESSVSFTPAAIGTAQEPAVKLYDSFDASSRSRELLEVLEINGLTPEELGTKMKPDNGNPLNKRQVRAVYRNLKRKQDDLVAKGTLSRPVVIADFDDYEVDQAGRYSISADDLAALDKHLGR
jgi:hypothetical protein